MNVKKLASLFASLARHCELGAMYAVTEYLTKLGYIVENSTPYGDYCILTPPEPSPVALLAHCDTVGKSPPERFTYRSGVITAKGGGVLGADDRAGVTAIVAAVALGARPQVYLTTGEECGGIGARCLEISDYSPPDTLNVLVQIDRRGSNDFVTYDCDSKPLNKWCRKFGWEHAEGSFTDISILAPSWGIAAANLSCGYYGEHTHNERLIIPQLAHTIDRICQMIASPPKKRLAYVERERSWYTVRHYSSWGSTQTTTNTVESNDDTVVLKSKDPAEDIAYGMTEVCENCGHVCDWGEINGRGFCLDCQTDWEIARTR